MDCRIPLAASSIDNDFVLSICWEQGSYISSYSRNNEALTLADDSVEKLFPCRPTETSVVKLMTNHQ